MATLILHLHADLLQLLLGPPHNLIGCCSLPSVEKDLLLHVHLHLHVFYPSTTQYRSHALTLFIILKVLNNVEKVKQGEERAEFSLGLLLQLFLQLCYLGLQGSDGGLEPVLHRTLQLAQLGPELLVLTLQLLASVFALLGCAALCTQLCGQGVHLGGWGVLGNRERKV